MSQRKHNVRFFYSDRTATANNKYMWALWNSSTSKVIEIRKITSLFHQVTNVVTPVLSELELRFIDTTAPTAGSDLTILSRDLTAAALADTIAKAGASTVADMTNGLIRRYLFDNTEQALADLVTLYHQQDKVLFEAKDDECGLILPTNKGAALKHVTNDNTSSISSLVEFIVY